MTEVDRNLLLEAVPYLGAPVIQLPLLNKCSLQAVTSFSISLEYRAASQPISTC